MSRKTTYLLLLAMCAMLFTSLPTIIAQEDVVPDGTGSNAELVDSSEIEYPNRVSSGMVTALEDEITPPLNHLNISNC